MVKVSDEGQGSRPEVVPVTKLTWTAERSLAGAACPCLALSLWDRKTEFYLSY